MFFNKFLKNSAKVSFLLLLDSLKALKLYSFPDNIRLKKRESISILATLYAGHLAKKFKKKVYSSTNSNLMENPFLRFHANYSLTHIDLNTPCTYSLSRDIGSIFDLSGLKILCLGARNLDEIFQLQLFCNANPRLITAVDLYSEIDQIESMDFHDLSFPDNSFDVIFWAGSYAYAHDPILAMREALRVLTPGGIFALGDTYIGDADYTSYRAKQSEYFSNPELDNSLNELPEGQKMTLSVRSIDEVLERLKMLSNNPKVVLSRDYVSSPHYNLICLVP
ncbi:class I SAM-dependent methyltransferase [bacterium]|nr:class I SAM-dependent methyltransferase [bacterium]